MASILSLLVVLQPLDHQWEYSGADQGDARKHEGQSRHRIVQKGMRGSAEAGDADHARDGTENAKCGENDEREWIAAHGVTVDEDATVTNACSGRQWQTCAL